MKTLTLLRHAKSGWDDAIPRDFDRPLNAKGRRAAAMMGRHIRSLGLGFDHVVASPAIRVRETIDDVGAGYGAALSPEWDRRLYLASAATIVEVIHDAPAGASRLLIVGHNPGLEDLVEMLVGAGDPALRAAAAQKYPTATIAELTVDLDWAGIGGGDATLTRFVRPRDLDAALGPDYD